MARSNCLGDDLPDVSYVECEGNADNLDGYCKCVPSGEEFLLYDYIPSKRGAYYYWLRLRADDDTSLIVCALEKYVDANNLEGRKADYFCMGWVFDPDLNTSTCYIVIVELRKELINENQFEDKVEQIKQTINLINSDLLDNISDSAFFDYACHKPDDYKIVGAIIPATRSKPRTHQTKKVTIGEKEYLIAAVPHERIRECKISWSELLVAIGVLQRAVRSRHS